MALKRVAKVALYLPSLAGGGAERVTVKLARGLARRGIAVDLVLARAAGPYLAEVAADVRVIDLGADRVLASLPGLVSYLRREKPDAMLSAMSHANIVALWARRLARVSTRLVVSHRTSYEGAYSKFSRAALGAPLVRRCYPWAEAIVAVSRGVADSLARTARLPRDRISVIYNPVVTDEMMSKARQALKHPWFAPNEPPVVLAVGRLTNEAKDYPTLFRAFALLRERYQARLLILGEGKARAELEELVRTLGLQDHVSMPGFVDNPYAYMARAAVFILSSEFEGLPGVLIEAMACGCPVVSTDCPSGPAEILDGGKFGRLVAVGDVSGMAEVILLALLQGRDDATRAAQERAMDFNLERAATAYHAVLLPTRECTGNLQHPGPHSSPRLRDDPSRKLDRQNAFELD